MDITRKSKIRDALKKTGRAMSLDEISTAINVSPKKIGQSLNTFEFSIVRVDTETYDLPSRFYKGRSFRVTPSNLEIEKNIIRADEELPIFLSANYDTLDPILLIDDDGDEYLIRTIKYVKTAVFEYYKGLNNWYVKHNFKFGDDIIFTCISYDDKKFQIKHVRASDRNEKLIALKNKILADCVYKVLSMTILKYEDIMFLFRKYMFTFPYNEDVPPDSIFKVLLSDNRFILSTRDQILSFSGEVPNWKIIGLSKYFYLSRNNDYVLVEVLSDEYGKFGSCSQCNERMIWDINAGWRHCKNDCEWADTDIPREFFKLGNPKI
jgi:hypothetical protein